LLIVDYFMKSIRVKKADQNRLLLEEDRDYEILEKIYLLEKKKLDKDQKELVRFLKSQLQDDWRKPLSQFLDKLIKRFKTK